MRLAIALAVALSPLAALAQADDCRSAKAVAAAQARIDSTLTAVAQDPGNRQAELGVEMKARAAEMGWSQARQGELLRQVLASPAFMAFENEKVLHVMALSKIVTTSSGPDAQTSKCQAAREAEALARKITDVNARQLRYAADEIARAAGTGK